MPGTITADQAGCWLDGAMGWHNTYRVIDLALSYGWLDDDRPAQDAATADSMAYYQARGCPDDDLTDRIHGLADDATDYLQSLAPDGYTFTWDAGELCLWADDDAEV
jgi:hypothetical protein